MFESIRGKRVLVTGGTGGIGSAMVRLFAEHGARVGIHYLQDEAQAQSLRDELRAAGAEAESFQADLTFAEEIPRLMEAFVERFGGIDVLINNAGAVSGSEDFRELCEEAWDRTFALNAKAPFLLAQAAYPHMRRQSSGRIINISSVAAKYGGDPARIHYAAAKAALEAVTAGLARACAAEGIRVSTIRGGFIDTPFHGKIGREELESRVRKIPLGRAGQSIDIARMALFLASEAGDFVTGEIMTVAGGD